MVIPPKNQSAGFSVLELTVGLTLFSVIALGSTGLLKGAFKKSQTIQAAAVESRIYKGPGQALIAAIEGADMALNFEHLPISASGCASAESPCVRKLGADGLLTDSSLPGVGSLEFFRDQEGALSGRKIFDATDTTELKYNAPLTAEAVASADQQYATWPLIGGETTRPFVILHRGKISDYFTFIDSFATATPAAAAGSWALFSSSRPGADVAAVKGSLVVIYNGYDPEQFTFQRVEDTLDCSVKASTGDSICLQSIALKLIPTFTNKASLLDGKTYGISLKPVTAAEMSGLLPASSGAFGSWWAQEGSFDLFPTLSMSIQDPSAADFHGDPDVRKLAHFYHSKTFGAAKDQPKGQMLVVPLTATAYRLADGSLLARTFGEHLEKTILRDLPPTSKIYFARRIGTQEVSLFQYQ